MKTVKAQLFIFNVLLLLVIAVIYSCSSSNILDTENNAKKPLLIYSKGKFYKTEWTKIDSLEQNGLTKTALKEVNAIHEKAKTEENYEQLIKSLLVRAKFQSFIEEDAFVKTLNQLNELAENSSYPLSPLLHSIIGESYWRYYQQNRWKFHDRTETINFDNNDISTWDLSKITEKSITHYLRSIQNIDSLKRTPVETYSEIILGDSSSNHYRPYLYDFLAHRATDFFMNEEASITKPIDAFVFDRISYLDPFDQFTKLQIKTKDSLSLKYFALQTLQKLTANHIQDIDPTALIDVELKRLKFVRNNAVFDSADSLYYSSLSRLYDKFKNHPTSTEISYELALEHHKKGITYKPLESDNNKWELKESLAICLSAIAKFPNSYGADRCRSLEHQIKMKSLDLIMEKVNLPNVPIKAKLRVKNLDDVHFKLVKVDFDDYIKWNRNNGRDKKIEGLLKIEPVKEWALALKADGDFQEHSGAFKIDNLSLGFYVLLASASNDFKHKENALAITPFWVSNLSYLTRNNDKGEVEFFVVDREKGIPLKGVEGQIYSKKYNYSTKQYELNSLGAKTTNNDGFFKVLPSGSYRNFYVDFSFNKDRLNTEDAHYQYKSYQHQKRRLKTVFFTDRAIYRPGQTVYFKGIILEVDAQNNNRIKSNLESTVTFYDVNNQRVSDLKLKTNDYGSFSGSFVTPNNGLNGQMYIGDSHGSTYFAVEEYKRPKFEVKFKPIKGVYKLEEEVSVVGTAKTYSGAALDGAEVKYRVVRNGSFPYWCFYRFGHWPRSEQMEIKNGIVSTDNNGEYKINFLAKADKLVDEKYSPTYSYTIYADVIDINGETHSSTAYLNIGYKALNIEVAVPDNVNKNDVDTFSLLTTNLSGQFEPAEGTLKVWALKMPNRYYRASLWSKGDRSFISKDEYLKSFPLDVYLDENNKYKWEKNAKVYDRKFNTSSSKFVKFLDFPNWKSGDYVLEAITYDKYGKEVKEVKYFTVYSELEKRVPTNDIGWFTSLKATGEPGQEASFLIGSAANNVKVLYEVKHKSKVVHKEWITLNAEQKKINILILEKYRGNFQVHFTFVKHGRSFSYASTVSVPYTNKMLNIEFETFRNKLLPGQKEEWKIKIKGEKGEKVAAEMVASLYDASLDAFRKHKWGLDVLSYDVDASNWQTNTSFSKVNSQLLSSRWNAVLSGLRTKKYDQLNWFGFNIGRNYNGNFLYKSKASMKMNALEDVELSAERSEVTDEKMRGNAVAAVASNAENVIKKEPLLAEDFLKVKTRKNFSETAFFYPELETNASGEIVVKFTIPEALTKWKFMGLAHTKDLKTGTLFEETVTQKELMVYPNAPRFFREGDQMNFNAKITNLSNKELLGDVKIFFYDALTNKLISDELLKEKDIKSFRLEKEKSTSVGFDISIPEGYSAIKYKVVAKSGSFSDGEEMIVPVLSNRMMVTESMPLPIRGNQKKKFEFDKLINNNSNTLKHHKLTLEFTSNPAWYAIQALPYLMEYPYECAEQTFSRYYANALASHIANSNPKIRTVFDQWKKSTPKAFLSSLEKNEELKSLILKETPWVLNAQNESERKKRVGLLFDFNRMNNEMDRSLKKLQELQVKNGGWSWFKGMPESRYITQHIVTGMGHLDHLGVAKIRNDDNTWGMLQSAIRYLDDRIKEDYEWLKKKGSDMNKDHLNYNVIQYLYARSYFIKDVQIAAKNNEAYTYYVRQAEKNWLTKSKYMQGMIALALHRDGKAKGGFNVEQKIMASLKENAINHEELGMYWKENVGGYYWYQAPVEIQSLLIEAFDEVASDQESVENMKVWLLKQKQTQDWKTTKATADACYALLLKGTDLLGSDQLVEIEVGSESIDPKKMDEVEVEAGTGYFKTSWSKTMIKPNMGNVTVTKNNEGVAWGALYWQYFEQLDKITPSETPLKLVKKMFLQRNTASGPVIDPIIEGTELKLGDKLKVRIELRVDRDMEYVHMKDMRASGLEPINVFSGYRYQDGLGYYESTSDASTNFFFDNLRKGTYVFEYALRVNMVGYFSNGITSIQSMYAPEFVSHSKGVRLKVREEN